jgi:hypothetical protein
MTTAVPQAALTGDEPLLEQDEAVPQAAPDTTTTAKLEGLRRKHGEHYLVGYDEVRGWWAARHGRTDHLLTAPGPGELGAAITRDKRRPPEEIECLRRTARAYGLAAYRACMRAGDEEAAARVAGEMQAFGLLEQGSSLAQLAAAPAVTAGAQLRVLREKWGHLYSVGYDPGLRGWWAVRNGVIGWYACEDSPGELDLAVMADHAAREAGR